MHPPRHILPCVPFLSFLRANILVAHTYHEHIHIHIHIDIHMNANLCMHVSTYYTHTYILNAPTSSYFALRSLSFLSASKYSCCSYIPRTYTYTYTYRHTYGCKSMYVCKHVLYTYIHTKCTHLVIFCPAFPFFPFCEQIFLLLIHTTNFSRLFYMCTPLYVCGCMCVYLYLCACKYVYVRACMYAYVCIYTYINTYVHTCMHANMYETNV